jgi:hypothetical protein
VIVVVVVALKECLISSVMYLTDSMEKIPNLKESEAS